MTIEEVKKQLEELIEDRRSMKSNLFDGDDNAIYDKDIEALKIARDAIGKTAHWDINTEGYFPYCSNCKYAPDTTMTLYCPQCGSRMINRG